MKFSNTRSLSLAITSDSNKPTIKVSHIFFTRLHDVDHKSINIHSGLAKAKTNSSERVCLSYMSLNSKALLVDPHAMGCVRLSCLRLAKYWMGDFPNIRCITHPTIMVHPTIMKWIFPRNHVETQGVAEGGGSMKVFAS